jgi:hypothetical protein
MQLKDLHLHQIQVLAWDLTDVALTLNIRLALVVMEIVSVTRLAICLVIVALIYI